MAATIKDIARISGLSVATVSKYINGGTLREKNRILLEKVIQEQNYRVNESARTLKTSQSRTIGLVVAEFKDVFTSELASAVVNELRKFQYSLIVCESHRTLEGEREAFDFLLSKQVAGIMATVVSSDSGLYKDLFAQCGVPVVLFDKKMDICDNVILDNVNAAYRATRILIEAGHQKIAIVRGKANSYTADCRYEGYCLAMREAGLKVRDDFAVSVDYSDTGSYGRVKELLQRPTRPTAVLAINYYTTMSTVMALNELNIAIPEEVSLFGFDNYYLSQLTKPRLWLMEQPIEAMAAEGTKMMLDRINRVNPEAHFRTVVFDANVIQGKSIRKL